MTAGEDRAEAEKDGDPALEALLDYLRKSRGFDFTGYKRASLSRRITRRLEMLGLRGYATYLDYLQVHPDEFPQLFNVVLINVTSFFRDEPAWTALATHVRKLVESRAPGAPLRVWCAGCASGEEAYSLAIVLSEILGADELLNRVKIYATDVDEEALAQARLANYTPKALEALPRPLVEKYFTLHNATYTFHKDLRRVVIFGRHDLVQDAPISRVDILSCRNTLMYFNAETQSRILGRFHFALAPGGLLFLGKAEMLLTHSALFSPLDLKLRLFARVGGAKGRLKDPALPVPAPLTGPSAPVQALSRIQRAALECLPLAIAVVDARGTVAFLNRRAMTMFSLAPADVGRPFHELEMSYRPAELRSIIDQVRGTKAPAALREVERALPDGEKLFVDIDAFPLISEVGETLGTQLCFTDSTRTQSLKNELSRMNGQLVAAHEELQSTSEELETTNEELQSTVEELETTNEELQSTNEELETMNEELQATNEELQTMNQELRDRGEDVDEANSFLASILASLRYGVAVLDGDLLVRAWNDQMTELWGLRKEEVEGKHFSNLDIGLPVDQLRMPIRATLADGATQNEMVLDCINRRGKPVRCKVTLRALEVDALKGVMLIVEELPPS